MQTSNSIGYSFFDHAASLGLNCAHMINSVGTTVEPSARTVQYSLEEFGAVPIAQARVLCMCCTHTRDTLLFVLQDGTGISLLKPHAYAAWPITSLAYVILRTQLYRQTCTIKTAAVEFFQWAFTSPSAQEIATQHGMIIMPANVL